MQQPIRLEAVKIGAIGFDRVEIERGKQPDVGQGKSRRRSRQSVAIRDTGDRADAGRQSHRGSADEEASASYSMNHAGLR
jgi:hypothetical protein